MRVKPERTGIRAVATMALLGGCAGAEPGTEATEHVRLTLSEVQRFGSLDGPGALSDVRDVLAGPELLYVLEGSPPRVMMFGRDGSFQGSFGGGGDGPGELRGPLEMGQADGRLWISDASAYELEFFSPTGAFVSSLRSQITDDSGGAPAGPRAYLSSGRVVAGPAILPIGAVLRGATDREIYYLMDSEDRILDTLFSARIPRTDFVQGALPGGGFMWGGHPLQERPLVAFFPDGSGMVVVERWQPVSGEPSTYQFSVWDAQGKPETTISVPYQPIPSNGWKEREIERMRAGDPDGGPHLERFLHVMLNAWSDRTFLPPITAAVAGDEGVVAIRRERTGEALDTWELLDRRGRKLGEFLLSVDASVLAVNRTRAWTLETDDLDVPYVAESRLTPGRNGSTTPTSYDVQFALIGHLPPLPLRNGANR